MDYTDKLTFVNPIFYTKVEINYMFAKNNNKVMPEFNFDIKPKGNKGFVKNKPLKISINNNISVVDNNTGEILTKRLVQMEFEEQTKKEIIKEFNSKIYLKFFNELVLSFQPLTNLAKSVLVFIAQRVYFGNNKSNLRLRFETTSLFYEECAEFCKSSTSGIRKVFPELLKNEFIFKYKNEEGVQYKNVYIINPKYVYVGDGENYFDDIYKLGKCGIFIDLRLQDFKYE